MMSRFPGKGFGWGAATAAALALSGCGGGSSDLNQVAATSANAQIPSIPAPNNGDWTQVVQETPEGGYRMGNPDAPVKLIEYASITCPHCAEFSEEGAEELTNQFVRSGQVSWEYRPFLLFPTDPGIFMLLRCQGPQTFFALTEQLYATQREWSGRTQQIPPSQLQSLQSMPAQQQAGALAKAIGMDQFFRQRGMPQARVDQCLSDMNVLNRLAEIQSYGQREDNVTGTPTFILNGTQLEGVGYWNKAPNQSLKPRLLQAIGS
jgi:protein-disulfide isomerase